MVKNTNKLTFFTGDTMSALDLLDREIMFEAYSFMLTRLRSVQIMMQAEIPSSSKQGHNRMAVEQIPYPSLYSLSSLGRAS